MEQAFESYIQTRIERLVTEGILDSLNFLDINVCNECTKGKQT